MSSTLPVLTTNAWVDDAYGIMEKLFVYFIASEGNQSTTFHGRVYSLKSLLAESTNSSTLCNNIENALTTMFIPYFREVTVSATEENINSDGYTPINISITAVTDTGEQIELSKLIEKNNNVIENYNELLSNYNVFYGSDTKD